MTATYAKLTSFLTDNAAKTAKFFEMDAPKNANAAWGYKSNRWNSVLEGKLTRTNGNRVPLLVKTGDDFFICMAILAEVCTNYYGDRGTHVINRKRYQLADAKAIENLKDAAGFWCDFSFSAGKNGESVPDRLDIAACLLNTIFDTDRNTALSLVPTAKTAEPVTEAPAAPVADPFPSFKTLSTGALITLDALIQNTFDVAGGDFGFMDEVLADLKASHGMTRHQFAGYVSNLSDFVDYSEDLSADKGVECNGIQFAMVYGLMENEALIAEINEAAKGLTFDSKPVVKKGDTAAPDTAADTVADQEAVASAVASAVAKPAESPEAELIDVKGTILATKTFLAQERTVTVNVYKDGIVVSWHAVDASEAAKLSSQTRYGSTVQDAKDAAYPHFSGRSKGIVGKWITMTHRAANK